MVRRVGGGCASLLPAYGDYPRSYIVYPISYNVHGYILYTWPPCCALSTCINRVRVLYVVCAYWLALFFLFELGWPCQKWGTTISSILSLPWEKGAGWCPYPYMALTISSFCVSVRRFFKLYPGLISISLHIYIHNPCGLAATPHSLA